ncbi:LysR family transcriptional regulator (plasmid) [Rhizobium freirei PRF 81]|uniref:LysR family transcriptional regulator n=1 Tax=Rhizobium freirei PRF 81 TaxID=363754 RepID=N6U0C5_9HYPH|nr:LysR family transcriptional regulator [Rhizobium freirei]ENN83858.1 LysR family transcriptional regulator [Rhizobium freirei PRF 81]
MDITWLQDFLAVAETGNFTRAANDRNASQPAFSRRIQALEAWLGVALIDRSVFPTRLTIEGERFRDQAAQILRNLLDLRTELGAEPTLRRDQVRLALPHALATGRLPEWWVDWSEGRALSCQLVPGNVHDTVTSLVAGDVDMLVCFHHAQQPIHLDPDVYERVELGTEKLKPYAARHVAEKFSLPGDPSAPLPLLAYSSGTYLGRMVDLAIESSGQSFSATPIFKSDMADVLRELTLTGTGVAWLPDCTASRAEERLVALDDDKWSMTLSVVAYRDRNNGSRALNRLWSAISQ